MDSNEILVAGDAFKAMLSHVDPDKQIPELVEQVKMTKSVSKRDALVKKIKYLGGLKETELHAKDAYVINHVPVVPPQMRPTTVMGGNRIELADVNNLYIDHMVANNALKKAVEYLPPEELVNERAQVYDGVKAIMGLGEAISPKSRGQGMKGLLRQVAGVNSPKSGFFHNKILSKKQDFSGRATIYAEPQLGFNEAAVPVDQLWTMYKFHILRDLSRQGYDYVNATKAWETRNPAATASFNRSIQRVPMIINRAPTLMKSNITAVFPVPVKGSTMGLNPIHLPLFAGDYDGDALTLHVPMSPEAVTEAREKLLPQHQIHDYRRGLGQSIVAPGHEAILGSMHMTEPDMKQKVHKFSTEADALAALRAGTIKENTPIEIEEHNRK
jgi:DNA-directed RNA polymerase subunit beta'